MNMNYKIHNIKKRETQPSSSLITQHCIKVLSWNIQSSNSVAGNKFDDQLFTNVFINHDFVCLQEIRQAVKVSGFRSMCQIRNSEKSGGVCILFKNELIGGVEEVKNSFNIPDIIICNYYNTRTTFSL